MKNGFSRSGFLKAALAAFGAWMLGRRRPESFLPGGKEGIRVRVPRHSVKRNG